MRRYLERIAAAAITPGGGFHPIAGSLYARPSDAPAPQNALPDAEQFQTLRNPASAGRDPEVALFDREPPNPLDRETLQPESPFLSVVQPLTVSSSASSPTRHAAPQPDLPLKKFPQQLSPEEATPQVTLSPLLSPATSSPRQTADRTKDHTSGQTKIQAKEQVETPPANPHKSRQQVSEEVPQVSEKAPPSPSSNHEAQLSNVSQPVAPPTSFTASTAPSRQRSPQQPFTSSNPTVSAPARPTETQAATRPSRPTAPISSPIAPSPQQTSPDTSPYQPLVASYAPPPHSPSATSALQPRPQNSRPEPPRERPRPFPEQHQPDEIQIHIGRIEVTAVAPAPTARTQPTTIRKTPSLDDYLRRSNGRA